MDFGIFTRSCDHHCYLILEHFYHPSKETQDPTVVTLHLSQSLITTYLLFPSINYLSGHFIKIESSYNMWPVMSSILCLA